MESKKSKNVNFTLLDLKVTSPSPLPPSPLLSLALTALILVVIVVDINRLQRHKALMPKSQTCGRGEIRHCTEAESYFILHVLRQYCIDT